MRVVCPTAGPAALILLALALPAQGAAPQTTAALPNASPYTVQPLSDADLLADQVRALALDPLDLNALVRAGELALKVDDDIAAAAFFSRAERIDPRNARVKAGQGSLLVSAERPGEALRRFAEAEALGADVRGFAAERGLAYDLIGEQERAQRDYRLALKAAGNDETQRRYALSLGISGKRELALAQIDPLLRRSDRGAWRARAFILAMAGDQSGADHIATSMMPGGLAQGLQPFFAILPTLPPADRAFAVHFGEVRSTPTRLADARLVPPLAALGPDPNAPVVVAALKLTPPAREDRRKTRKRRDRDREPDRTEVAAVVPPPETTPPPAYRPPVVLAAVTPPRVAPALVAQPLPRVATPAPAAVSAPQPAVRPAPVPAPVSAPPRPEADTRVAVAASLPPASVARVVTAPALPTVATVQPAPTALIATAPIATAPKPIASPVAVAPTPVRSEESILASILADIKVPSSELENAPAPEPAPAPDRTSAPVQALVPDPANAEKAEKQATERKLADKKAADKKLADKKIADKKIADAKAADAKAADAAKKAEEARKHDPKLLEPARVWVQVAGGASERDLAKAWARMREKSAVAFKGKSGWTTPLRATNRVLTGPFKSDGEAQAFVNLVAKDGLSAFVFTSDAGQKITRLDAK